MPWLMRSAKAGEGLLFQVARPSTMAASACRSVVPSKTAMRHAVQPAWIARHTMAARAVRSALFLTGGLVAHVTLTPILLAVGTPSRAHYEPRHTGDSGTAVPGAISAALPGLPVLSDRHGDVFAPVPNQRHVRARRGAEMVRALVDQRRSLMNVTPRRENLVHGSWLHEVGLQRQELQLQP